MTQREIERALTRFEGLVYETARQIVAGGVEMEFDDVRQVLRIKVWQALQAYDSGHRKGLSLRRFVFMCVTNTRKDIEKRPRRYNASIEGIRERVGIATATTATGTIADWFDARYLSVAAEEVFGGVEEEHALPETLTPIERQVVELRLAGHLLLEIDRALGLSRAQRERVMCSLREKLAPRETSDSESEATWPLHDPSLMKVA